MDRTNSKEEFALGKEAILRTTMGDIHVCLFPEETPHTVEIFSGHAKRGYYDNAIFHRVIKEASCCRQVIH
jgi:peptidylprolyl isomerase domain and WD repeat-containing protein 1